MKNTYLSILLFFLLIIPSSVVGQDLNYAVQFTVKNVDGSERTRLYLTSKSKCNSDLKRIVAQTKATMGVTSVFGEKCGNASYLQSFFNRDPMHVPYIISGNNRDVLILNGASYEACMAMAAVTGTTCIPE